MDEVIFWGGTGQAKVIYEAILSSNYKLVALVDNNHIISPFSGVPVLKGESGLDSWMANRDTNKQLHATVAIGGSNGFDRLTLMDLLRKRDINLITVIHRTAFVAKNTSIGEGCQLLAQSAICTHVSLGNGVIINTSASIDHDCIIGNGVHVAPGAHLAGEIIVDDQAFIGIGATVLPRVHIGANAIVGAGAIVIEDVPSGATVAGSPARVINFK